MDPADQCRAFQADLENLIHRYMREFDLTVADAVGFLECVKLDLWANEREAQDKEE